MSDEETPSDAPEPGPSRLEREGDDADPAIWDEEDAAAHHAAVDAAFDAIKAIDGWQPTVHERYLAEAAPDFSGYKMPVEAKARALKAYASTGRLNMAAAAGGVCPQTIKNHLRDDELFARLWDEAKEEFATRLQLGLFQRGFIGTPEPIVGRVAKDCDGVIGYKLTRSDNIALALGRAFLPELREKVDHDVNVSGGVLVVSAALTDDEWEARWSVPREQPTIPLLESIRGQIEREVEGKA